MTIPKPFCGIAKALYRASIKQWNSGTTIEDSDRLKSLIRKLSVKFKKDLLYQKRQILRITVGPLTGY